MRLVVYPIIYRVLAPSQVVVWDIWTINSKSAFGSSKWNGLITQNGRSQKTLSKGSRIKHLKRWLWKNRVQQKGCVCGHPYQKWRGVVNLVQCFQSECGSFSKWIRLWSLGATFFWDGEWCEPSQMGPWLLGLATLRCLEQVPKIFSQMVVIFKAMTPMVQSEKNHLAIGMVVHDPVTIRIFKKWGNRQL